MDIERLRLSWAQVAASGDSVPRYFYAQLFRDHPELRELFPRQMSGQRDRLVRAMSRILQQVDDPQRLVPFLHELGASHATRYHVKDEYYAFVADAFLGTLAHFSGQYWTSVIRDDWVEALTFAAETMIEGGKAAPPAILVQPSARSAVTITPEALRQWPLPKARWWSNGYSTREVDDVLALASMELAQKEEDLEALQRRLAEAEERNDQLQQYYKGVNSDLALEAANLRSPRSDAARASVSEA